MENRTRKQLRLDSYNYSSEGLYFITICTKRFRYLFGQIENDEMLLNQLGKRVSICWESIPMYYPAIVIHQFVVMPNHLHGILEIREEKQPNRRNSISLAIRGFKGEITKWAKNKGYTEGLWQRGFYDHIIRNQDSVLKIENYIIENSLNWSNDKFHLK